MIHYNGDKAVFHLQGPTYSCLLGVCDGVLLQWYWGARLPDDTADGLLACPH